MITSLPTPFASLLMAGGGTGPLRALTEGEVKEGEEDVAGYIRRLSSAGFSSSRLSRLLTAISDPADSEETKEEKKFAASLEDNETGEAWASLGDDPDLDGGPAPPLPARTPGAIRKGAKVRVKPPAVVVSGTTGASSSSSSTSSLSSLAGGSVSVGASSSSEPTGRAGGAQSPVPRSTLSRSDAGLLSKLLSR